MRSPLLVLTTLALAACATDADYGQQGSIEIVATSQGQVVPQAQCVVANARGRWDVTAPSVVPVGPPDSELQVVCSKPGYRNSQVVIRPTPYGLAGYPNVGVGVAGGSGGGVGVGLNFPIGGTRASGGYPARVVVEMTPQ
jgi:hypothetical protein